MSGEKYLEDEEFVLAMRRIFRPTRKIIEAILQRLGMEICFHCYTIIEGSIHEVQKEVQYDGTSELRRLTFCDKCWNEVKHRYAD